VVDYEYVELSPQKPTLAFKLMEVGTMVRLSRGVTHYAEDCVARVETSLRH
jgi:hypothetical protein